MVRPSPLSRLHNWWCDIRHNCHKNHRGRGASLSSQKGGKIVFKDFFSRPPEEGGSLSSRNFSSLIFNGKRILQGVLITLKIFYPVEVSLIAKNLHTTIQSWKLTRRSRAWYNYCSFRFPRGYAMNESWQNTVRNIPLFWENIWCSARKIGRTLTKTTSALQKAEQI